jgi:Flp pilus assembly pilin Flp
MRRDTRGTTMVEYGLLLFVVLVVCAVGIKVLGITLQHKFKQANNSVAGQPESANAGQPNYGGTGVASASPSAPPRATDINKDPTNTTGGGPGEKEAQAASGLPMIARFALLALGVIGTVAAFFAMKKQKTG